MDELGIDYMIISWVTMCCKWWLVLTLSSHTAPLAHGENDSSVAEALATRANGYLYDNIKNNTERFGGFAMLSLHNATQAADELERAVKNYGYHGAFAYKLS